MNAFYTLLWSFGIFTAFSSQATPFGLVLAKKRSTMISHAASRSASTEYHAKVTQRNAEMIPEVPCAGLEENVQRITECITEGKFPVKDECKAYLDCSGNDPNPEITCCPEGLHFDHIVRNCTPEEEARCKDVCLEEGKIYEDPFKISAYLQCSGLGIPEEVECPDGELFVTTESKCIPLIVSISKLLATRDTESETENPVDHELVNSLLHTAELIGELLLEVQ